MKINKNLMLASVACIFAIVLSGCQTPTMLNSPGAHQVTSWQFGLVNDLTANVYVGGMPVRGGGCPPQQRPMPIPRPHPGNYRPPYGGQCGGNSLYRNGSWIPQWGLTPDRYPVYPPRHPGPPPNYYGGQNGGQSQQQWQNQQQHQNVIVENENINNNNNVVRYERRGQ